jgi:hypothetical protein
MISDPQTFVLFLIEAKKHTYAGGAEPAPSTRPASHDLSYERGDYYYHDTYLGGLDFAGEEAVWQAGEPLWSMNYYGRMLAGEIPEAFGDFLKAALSAVPPEAPFRGPASYDQGELHYACHWQGDLSFFSGRETISYRGTVIYELLFHGGDIR